MASNHGSSGGGFGVVEEVEEDCCGAVFPVVVVCFDPWAVVAIGDGAFAYVEFDEA